jgi:glucose-1-phosphate adenylyltransferase
MIDGEEIMMSRFTILSYPTSSSNSLLSLTDSRSRYMLPIGGRFRVIDFTIRNSVSSNAASTLIFNSHEDQLQQYIDNYSSDSSEIKSHKIIVHPYNPSDIESILDVLIGIDTSFFVLYNGDNPSIINLSEVFEKFKASKKKSLLIKLRIAEKVSMAYKVVICEKKKIISLMKKALKDKNRSLNFFELIINTLIHSGINTTILDAYYWPINSLTDYYSLNREIIWNKEISDALVNEKIIQSKIRTNRFTLLDERCSVKSSAISDHCYINGKVENSIIFPCVDIEEGAVVIDSIILPYVRIGPGARIRNSIIDESTDENIGESNRKFNIGRNCIIGSEEKYIKNNDFPNLLNSSITLIGKNNYIKEGVSIGSACYIASNSSEEYFNIKSKLNDGESIM